MAILTYQNMVLLMYLKHICLLLGALMLYAGLSWTQPAFLAKVWQDGQYGFIDLNGREVIPQIYDDVKEFGEGLLPVNIGASGNLEKQGGLWGFCDYGGRVVIKMQYQDVRSFRGGMAAVKLNGHWGFINQKGVLVVPATYEAVGDFSKGLAGVRVAGKWGYINRQGKLEIPVSYDRVYAFSKEGLAVVFNGSFSIREGKAYAEGMYGLIDRAGTIKLHLAYDEIGAFSEGIARVRRHDSVGYINDQAQLLVPPTYSDGGDFHEGRARVSVTEMVLKPFENSRDQALYDSLFALTMKKIRQAGEDRKKLEQVFNSPVALKLVTLQTGRGEKRDRHGFVDRQGKLAIPLQYDWAADFKAGLAKVRYGPDHRSALIATHSQVSESDPLLSIPPPQKGATDTIRGFGYIDRNGKTVIPTIYESALRCRDSIFIVSDGRKVQAVNSRNRVIVPPGYKQLHYCSSGLFIFKGIDAQGLVWQNRLDEKILLDPAFEEISYLNYQRFAVKRADGKWGIIDARGRWIRQPVFEYITSYQQVGGAD